MDKRPIIVLDYSEHRVENDQDISGPEGFRVTVNDFQYGSLEWKDQAAYWTAGVLMAALPTVYAAAAAVITARIYYRIKLRTPFQLLKTGMEHISDHNLDFQIQCTQEDEAGMLCRMFEEMRTEVYQSNSRMWETLQERKLLTTSVSHDLRTPITVVKGYLEYLQKAEKSEKLSEEVLTRIISEMQQAVARMERYIDCVRDIQNLDDIEIRKEPCRMIDLKADIERSFSLIAEKRGRKFQIQDHFRREILYTDRDMLMRILENIFDNAVRYSKSILRAFSALVDDAGTVPLTSQNKLQGHREKGIDDYTGSYKATYSDFAGTELLFGGTTLKREAGNTIRINCSLSLESGEAAVSLCSGAEDSVILLSESGEYDDTVEVDGTSTYVGVWGDHADGTVSVEIE